MLEPHELDQRSRLAHAARRNVRINKKLMQERRQAHEAARWARAYAHKSNPQASADEAEEN